MTSTISTIQLDTNFIISILQSLTTSNITEIILIISLPNCSPCEILKESIKLLPSNYHIHYIDHNTLCEQDKKKILKVPYVITFDINKQINNIIKEENKSIFEIINITEYCSKYDAQNIFHFFEKYNLDF